MAAAAVEAAMPDWLVAVHYGAVGAHAAWCHCTERHFQLLLMPVHSCFSSPAAAAVAAVGAAVVNGAVGLPALAERKPATWSACQARQCWAEVAWAVPLLDWTPPSRAGW